LRDGLLLCHTCGREIIQGQGHANEIQSDDHFLCDKCNKQFPDVESLYQHKAKDHGMSYQCDVCKELEALKQLVLVISVVSAMPSLKLPLNLRII
jgi:DNA-directed RNA polymerase subunit RPC12/RpoP